jgi:class 3 adenylate cyclase
MMPGMDGIETVRRLKSDPNLPYIPVIMLTARSDKADVIAGLEAGADDYLAKPADHGSLVARVRAALRTKRLQDRIAEQAKELSKWNEQLESRVNEQVAELEKMKRLSRFLAPQVAQSILASPDAERVLESHRGEVAVLFSDLRGFTTFSETGEPEELIAVLREYHRVVGDTVFKHGGTLERFAGDGIMVVFNDPIPIEDYCGRAAQVAREILDGCAPFVARVNRLGIDLGVGIGIAKGFATLGRIGTRDRLDYAAIGTVTNVAARLSSRATAGQVLTDPRFATALGDMWPTRSVGQLEIKGLSRPLPVFELLDRSPGADRLSA